MLSFTGIGQVSITPQLPPIGVMLKKQLWNASVVYTGNASIYVRINLAITDIATNQPVITANTGTILLSNGAKQIKAEDLAPIKYQYLLDGFTDRNPDGFLPAGSYQACYTVILSDEFNGTPLAEDCVPFEVQPLSPPLLNFPSNEDTIQTKLPQFTWLPPSPLNIFGNLSYRFNLVEVQPGQNPLDAVTQNIPLYANNFCGDLFVNYPSSGYALDTGKTYAWQVIAQNNLQPLSQSEVWTFVIADSSLVPKPSNINYILLKNSLNIGSNIVVDHMINLRYYSFDSLHTAEIKFLSGDGKIIKVAHQAIAYGNNYLSYPLNKNFNTGEAYTVEIVDMQHHKYSALFIVK